MLKVVVIVLLHGVLGVVDSGVSVPVLVIGLLSGCLTIIRLVKHSGLGLSLLRLLLLLVKELLVLNNRLGVGLNWSCVQVNMLFLFHSVPHSILLVHFRRQVVHFRINVAPYRRHLREHPALHLRVLEPVGLVLG